MYLLNLGPFNDSSFVKMDINIFPETGRIIVSNCLGVPECYKNLGNLLVIVLIKELTHKQPCLITFKDRIGF